MKVFVPAFIALVTLSGMNVHAGDGSTATRVTPSAKTKLFVAGGVTACWSIVQKIVCSFASDPSRQTWLASYQTLYV